MAKIKGVYKSEKPVYSRAVLGGTVHNDTFWEGGIPEFMEALKGIGVNTPEDYIHVFDEAMNEIMTILPNEEGRDWEILF